MQPTRHLTFPRVSALHGDLKGRVAPRTAEKVSCYTLPVQRNDAQSVEILAIDALCQSYGEHQVLKNLSLTLRRGEILGVIGENGAGKSTLVKCVLGMLRPVSGRIDLRCSAAAIHQELNLADTLPVYANFFLGRELRNRFGLLDIPAMARRVADGLGRIGLAIDPFAETGALTVSEKQMVEIARALDIDAELLILDEPSALLDDSETRRLFAIMRQLREDGTAMVYISHKLGEIREICDRVAILRDGELVGAGRAADLTPREMAERMVGRPLADIYPEIPPPAPEVALAFHSASLGDLEIHAGEIVGIAGLADSGQNELGEMIAGFRRLRDGTLAVGGHSVRFRSPRDAVAAGIGFLTSDRNASGVWRDFSIAENIGLGALDRFSRRGFVMRGAVGEAAERVADEFSIRCHGVGDAVATLSGGNAQKVAIAKVLASNPSVLVLNELTQGVDVGARQEIYALIGRLARAGLAVMLVSSDMTELLGLCRRIAVLRDGRLVGEVTDDRLTEKDIIRLATGTEGDARKQAP